MGVATAVLLGVLSVELWWGWQGGCNSRIRLSFPALCSHYSTVGVSVFHKTSDCAKITFFLHLDSRNYFLTCRWYQELGFLYGSRQCVGLCRVILHLVYALPSLFRRVVRILVWHRGVGAGSCCMNGTHPSLPPGAHRILNEQQQAGTMLGSAHMCFALMVVLSEDGFCRNCGTPRTTCLVVAKLESMCQISPMSVVVAIWINIPWGMWRVSSLSTAPLCVGRQFLW